VKLGKYIQLLLPEHETVIIPGFGAFVSNYKPAEIDKESDEIKPPSKMVTFNQKIRNNDGLLITTIAEKEGISHFEALQKIETDRENMLYQLDKGEKVTLEKIGEFQYDDQHNIQFNPFEGENLLLDAYGLGTAYPIKEIPEEPVDETEKEKEETATPIAAVVEEHLPEKETLEKDPPSEGVKELKTVPEEMEEEKKNRGWLWFLLILLPLIIVGIFMIRKNNEEKPPITEVNEKPVITDIAPDEAEPVSAIADSLRTDTVKIAAAEDSAKMLQKDTAAFASVDDTAGSVKYVEPDSSKYYLVAGSFKEKENADKFFAELESQGHNPFHLGKQGNFYIIGLGEYEREWQAFRAQDDFLERHPESGVWIYQVE